MKQAQHIHGRTGTSDQRGSIDQDGGSTDERILIVLDPDRPAESMEEALPVERSSDMKIHLLLVYPQSTYEARRRGHAQAGVTAPFSVKHLAYEAEGIAMDLGLHYLGSDSNFEVHGGVGTTSTCVSRVVEEFDIEHVRSSTGTSGYLAQIGGLAYRPTALLQRFVAQFTAISPGGKTTEAEDDAEDVGAVTAVVSSLLPLR